MNISNDSCIDKVDECIIYESAVNGAGVEDGEVGVLSAREVEVGVRVGVGMQSHAIDRVTSLAASLESHAISD